MNAILFFAVWIAAGLAAAVWWSPKASAWLSQLLLARSIALREARQVYRTRFREVRADAQ